MAASLILSDNRRQLVTSVQLYQPSFLYAYLAIFLQGGVIQVGPIFRPFRGLPLCLLYLCCVPTPFFHQNKSFSGSQFSTKKPDEMEQKSKSKRSRVEGEESSKSREWTTNHVSYSNFSSLSFLSPVLASYWTGWKKLLSTLCLLVNSHHSLSRQYQRIHFISANWMCCCTEVESETSQRLLDLFARPSYWWYSSWRDVDGQVRLTDW